MSKGRLEAFSDGVIAIIITVMVLELKVPKGTDIAALRPVLPSLLSYALSFVFVGIYWNNHHHLFQASNGVDGRVMWANLHLLFWLSLNPFVTGWLGENPWQAWPAATYGALQLISGSAYRILVVAMVTHDGPDSPLATAIGRDRKGLTSLALYVLAIGLAFVEVWLAYAIFVGVAALWLIPDRRISARVDRASSV